MTIDLSHTSIVFVACAVQLTQLIVPLSLRCRRGELWLQSSGELALQIYTHKTRESENATGTLLNYEEKAGEIIQMAPFMSHPHFHLPFGDQVRLFFRFSSTMVSYLLFIKDQKSISVNIWGRFYYFYRTGGRHHRCLWNHSRHHLPALENLQQLLL